MKNLDLNTREGRQSFYRSKEWKTLREYMLRSNPLCEKCLEDLIITPATDVHHIVDIKYKPHLRLDINNLQCLCDKCHKEITISEFTNTESANKPVNKVWNTKITKLKRL